MLVGDYIAQMIDKAGFKQSEVAREIGVSRQLLSFVVLGKRDPSMSLALKLESYLNIPEGKLLKIQTEEQIKRYKEKIKSDLIEKLIHLNAFWSYDLSDVKNISDEEVIVKTFEILDLVDISRLFEIYPRVFVKKIWKMRMAIQGDYLYQLNIFIALFYFGIEHPEDYLKKQEKLYISKSINRA